MSDLLSMGLELAVLVTGLGVLLLDLWAPASQKRQVIYVAAAALGLIFIGSFAVLVPEPVRTFGGMFVLDELALYFKRFFLLAAIGVLIMSVECADPAEGGLAEYAALTLFALAGMMLAASAHHLALLFVALELITVTFYVLTGFARRRVTSLEAGVKYLILGALSSAFLVYGIALVFGATGTMDFARLAGAPAALLHSRLFQLGLLMVLAGLGFKLAVVPFQFWAPDVYQGAPTPTTAFLAVGSKAAGVVLMIRLLYGAVPSLAPQWTRLLIVVAAATMIYGVLCAIPQRNLKRLLGYSSVANAGYLLLGLVTFSQAGLGAVLYYLAGYLFTLLAAFYVISLAMRTTAAEDIGALTGLHRRSPLLAATLALAMVSLAGIPPLAGFFGKFLLIKAALARAGAVPGLYPLVAITLIAVVASLSYYFGVVRALYWPGGETAAAPAEPIALSGLTRAVLVVTIVAMLWLGLAPDKVLNLAEFAVRTIAP